MYIHPKAWQKVSIKMYRFDHFWEKQDEGQRKKPRNEKALGGVKKKGTGKKHVAFLCNGAVLSDQR